MCLFHKIHTEKKPVLLLRNLNERNAVFSTESVRELVGVFVCVCANPIYFGKTVSRSLLPPYANTENHSLQRIRMGTIKKLSRLSHGLLMKDHQVAILLNRLAKALVIPLDGDQ